MSEQEAQYGGFESPEELAAAYEEARAEAAQFESESRQRAGRIEALEEQTRTYNQLLAEQRASTPDPTAEAYEELAQGNITKEGMEKLLEAKVAATVANTLAPVIAASQAAQALTPETSRFLQENPEVQRTYTEIATINPQAAASYANELAGVRSSEVKAQAEDAAIKAKRAEQRLDSRVIAPQSTSRAEAADAPDRQRQQQREALKQKAFAGEQGANRALIHSILFPGGQPTGAVRDMMSNWSDSSRPSES